MKSKRGFVIGLDTLIAISLISTATVYFMYEYNIGIKTVSAYELEGLNLLNSSTYLQNLLLLKYNNGINNSSFIYAMKAYDYTLVQVNMSLLPVSIQNRAGRLAVLDGKIYEIVGR